MNDYIVIPCQLIRDNNLTNTELYLLMEINQLSMLQYGCIASNEHFANKFNIKKSSVSRSLNELKRKGFLNIEIKAGSRNFDRKITINKMLFVSSQNVIAPLTKCEETKDKVTSKKTNNTYDAFISYLKSKSKYKTKVTKTKDGEKLFKQIEDKKQLVIDYLRHQEEKKEYSVRITAFMEDYETVYKQQETTNDKFGGWSE